MKKLIYRVGNALVPGSKTAQSLQNFDINTQLSNLKESEVQVTFRDIWIDYTNYRKAFYYRRVGPEPRQRRIDEHVPVDFDKVKSKSMIKNWFAVASTKIDGSHDHLLVGLIFLTSALCGHITYFKIMGRFYDFEDPLASKETDEEKISGEATMRRMKYKRIVKNF